MQFSQKMIVIALEESNSQALRNRIHLEQKYVTFTFLKLNEYVCHSFLCLIYIINFIH